MTTRRLGELLAGLPGHALTGDPALTITSITADSRAVKAGALFVCVRGPDRDGHSYLVAARAAGAVAALVVRGAAVPAGWPAVVEVDDEKAALGFLAAAWFGHPERELTIVGITGTNGKTTTTHLIESIEAARVRTTAVIGTIEYRIGDHGVPALNTTPDIVTLMGFFRRAVEAGARTVAMEVSSHGLHQQRVAGIPFDAMVFTNLTRDHLDYHRTMDEYYAAKKMLFAHGRQPDSGKAINLDDEYGRRLAAETGGRVIGFSADPARAAAAVVAAEQIALHARGSRFTLRLDTERHPLELPLAARHNVENALAAAAAMFAVGAPGSAIVAGLTRAPQVPGRLERVHLRCPFTVLVDYAHTPDALEKVLQSAREFTPGRLIAVFGCGGDRDRTKRPLMGRIAGERSDLAVVTSDNPRTEDPQRIIAEILAGMTPAMNRQVEPDRRAAIAAALGAARAGDTVVVAGKGHETYQIVGREKHPFNDVTVVTEEARKCRS